MIRFLVRFLGFIGMAVGFVGLIIDGTRSIANGTLAFTSLGEIARLFPSLEPTVVSHLHPALWDPVLTTLFRLPASILGFGLGLALLWLARRPAEPIGHLAGP